VGAPIHDPQGTAIMWGTSEADAIMWGRRTTGDSLGHDHHDVAGFAVIAEEDGRKSSVFSHQSSALIPAAPQPWEFATRSVAASPCLIDDGGGKHQLWFRDAAGSADPERCRGATAHAMPMLMMQANHRRRKDGLVPRIG
jgi:hypothetical protein